MTDIDSIELAKEIRKSKEPWSLWYKVRDLGFVDEELEKAIIKRIPDVAKAVESAESPTDVLFGLYHVPIWTQAPEFIDAVNKRIKDIAEELANDIPTNEPLLAIRGIQHIDILADKSEIHEALEKVAETLMDRGHWSDCTRLQDLLIGIDIFPSLDKQECVQKLVEKIQDFMEDECGG